MAKNDFVVIYVTKAKKEVKRDWNPKFIPRVNEEVSFECTESNLLDHEKYNTYRITRIVNMPPEGICIWLDI